MSSIFTQDHFNGVITMPIYCGAVVVVTLPDNSKRALSLQQYKYSESDYSIVDRISTEDELKVCPATKSELERFWFDGSMTQKNQKHKGGAWGENNILGGNREWMADVWVGDDVILDVTERTANFWIATVKVLKNDKEYIGYLFDKPTKQLAVDSLLLLQINSDLFIRVLRRGDGHGVDMKNKIIPLAGEHIESADQNISEASRRAITEEMGDFDLKGVEFELEPEDKADRDPRYDIWCVMKDDNTYVEVGVARGSKTHPFVTLIKASSHSDVKFTTPTDTDEISSTNWIKVEDLLKDTSEFGWQSHIDLVKQAVKVVNTT